AQNRAAIFLELLAHRAWNPPPSSSLAEERTPPLPPPPRAGARFPTLAAAMNAPRPMLRSITVSVMGELRLYAIGIEEVRGMFGAPPQVADHLREVAQRAFAPPSLEARGGLLSKLGPIFKR